MPPKQKKSQRSGKGKPTNSRASKAVIAQAVKAALPQLRKGKSRNARVLAYAVLNPTGSPPVRFPSTFGCDETAVEKLSTAVQLPFPTYAGTYAGVGLTVTSGLLYAALFRDPLRSLVFLSPSEPIYKYAARFATPTGIAATYGIPALVAPFDVNPVYFVQTTGGSPHGPILFCGTGENPRQTYFWWDVGVKLTFTQQQAVPGDAIFLEAYGDGSDAGAIGITFAGGVATTYTLAATDFGGSAAKGVYVRVVYSSSAATANQTLAITLESLAASDVFCHRAANGIQAHLTQLTNARVNAASLLLKNTAPPMFKGGFVAGANLLPTVPWNSLVGLSTFMSYANGRHYKEHGWEQGMYGCLHPGDVEDTDFYGYVHCDPATGVLQRCSYPLQRSRYSMFVIRCEQIANVSNMETHLFHTVMMELQTTDPWLNARSTAFSIQDQMDALDLLRTSEFFYENPNHLAAIGRFVQGAGSFFRSHAGKIGAALSALFPQYSGLIAPAAALAQS